MGKHSVWLILETIGKRQRVKVRVIEAKVEPWDLDPLTAHEVEFPLRQANALAQAEARAGEAPGSPVERSGEAPVVLEPPEGEGDESREPGAPVEPSAGPPEPLTEEEVAAERKDQAMGWASEG